MAILKEHIHLYREIFKIPGFFSEPFLMLGYQDISGFNLSADFNYKDVKQLLNARGVKNVKSIDLFDERADLKYDMNLPVPEYEYGQYSVLLDLGSLEHLFDTKQCLENCLKMVKVDGLFVLNTVVNGYFNHGFHVFNPSGLTDFLLLNGCEILYKKYSTAFGDTVVDPSVKDDILIWLVAKKCKSIHKINLPQQKLYEDFYKNPPRNRVSKVKKPLQYIVYMLLGAEGVQAAGLFWRALLRRLRCKKYEG